ncbi:MAG: molybdopterin molybdotransferase MoeA [Thalassobaculum sp.]|uniref:molybdopterin molybdotransferase MoeA n=1 Tax=Thalassobaculum sp. TaxID=2022740 RepID=UPI0032EDF617
MVQLTDDCFAFDGGLMPVDQALARVRERLVPVTAVETAPLDATLGRILAADVTADMDVPPHDNSAVDGWAVYAADLAADGETRLPAGGRVAAGERLDRPQRRGETVRIFTGAPMPLGPDGAPGPDTVFMQEDCRLDGATVVFPAGIRRGANRRFAGEDVRTGTTVLRAGRRLGPPDIGLAASIGLRALPVRTGLRVAVFSTGDEVREPGSERGAATIYDSNRYTLKALLRALGCAVTDLGILADDRETIRAALVDAAAGHDVLITSGGVSTGEEDHVRAAVEAEGRLDAWRLAIKPGRPVALGVVRGKAFLGLPGNPVAVVVTFLHVARPVLLALAGAEVRDPPRFPVRAAFDYRKKPGRREYVRVRLEPVPGGLPVARRAGSEGAGVLSSLVAADGLVELADDALGLSEGDTAAYLPFSEVMR